MIPDRKSSHLFTLAWQAYKTAHSTFHLHSHPSVNLVCFMSQQAVELWFKGVLEVSGAPPQITHNLLELNDLVTALHPVLGELNRVCATLNRYSVTPRYSDALDLGDHEANEALQCAYQVFLKLQLLEYDVERPELPLDPDKPTIWTQSRIDLLHEQYIQGEVSIKAVERSLHNLCADQECQNLITVWKEERQSFIRSQSLRTRSRSKPPER